ncbi:WG repeat-containing protein [Okeania sp. SIO2B3]|uniref:WG repeat-containing protein n=1 Tax=Okeania sp. SIO2B3 TaxID=2607784 RepID=UPI0034483EFE
MGLFNEVRSQKSEVRSYFCNGDLSPAPKILRLKRRGCATHIILINYKGKIVIDFIYDFADSFSQGIARFNNE